MKRASSALSACVFACLVMFVLPACSLLGENAQRAGKAAGKAVTFYCENVTLPELREEIRAAVNQYAAPHTVFVTCSNGTTMSTSE